MVSTCYWGPCLPVLLTALFLPIASGSAKQEEIASASAAPAFYSQVSRPSASPSRPEQHTVIHMSNPESLTHGEPGNCPGQRRIEWEWGALRGGSSGVWTPTHRDPSSLHHRRYLPTIPRRSVRLRSAGISCPPLSPPRYGPVFLSLWMPVALPLQPQPQGRCMTRGMTTGHQASMGIVTMTSTVAGLPWAGWPSCSGTWGQVGQDARKGEEGK